MVGDGVASGRVGERVWVWNAQWARAFGTCAEYVTLKSEQAVRLPANTSFDVGACLGIPAMTAYHAVAVSGAAAGKTILVAGGAGAVGHHAVQFAKAAGATVIATVSSATKAEMARTAGADHTIDYKRENVGERVMAVTGKQGVDAVIELDIAANAKLLPNVLRPRGKVVVYGTGAMEAVLPLFFSCATPLRCNSSMSTSSTPPNGPRRSAQSRGRLKPARSRRISAPRFRSPISSPRMRPSSRVTCSATSWSD